MGMIQLLIIHILVRLMMFSNISSRPLNLTALFSHLIDTQSPRLAPYQVQEKNIWFEVTTLIKPSQVPSSPCVVHVNVYREVLWPGIK